MTVKELTRNDIRVAWIKYYGDDDAETFLLEDVEPFLDRVLARGDSVLLFENHDLGHPELGHPRLGSYGSERALFPKSRYPEPPKFHPDFPTEILWRYCLVGALAP